MPLEVRLLIGLALAMAIVYATTPVAIRVAAHFDFYDQPVGYKGHAAPTPYLGGAAVMTGFVVTILALTSDLRQTLPIVGGVATLWIVGTIDDRRLVAVWQRVAVEVGLAATLWALGLGWSLGLGAAIDLLATTLWVLAVVNAFNLFDNMDGASSTMACVVAAAVAALGLVQSDVWLVGAGAALCGACLGFLPHNLSRPSARIFLGDGGSMPVGFAIAALVMIGASAAAAEWQALVMGLLLVGVPALDTCLVVVSRRRRGVPILAGGRDHLTHRTGERMRNARAGVAALGAAQAMLAALALVAVRGGPALLVPVVLLYLVGMATLIAMLDAEPRAAALPELASPAAAVAEVPLCGVDATAGDQPAGRMGAGRASAWPALAILATIGVALGLSPFAGGYYDSSIWAPAGLGLLIVLTAALIAAPVALPRRAILAPAAIALLALLSLASALWTDSIEQTVVEGNRLLIYAAGLALLVVLLRSDRGAVVAFGAFAVAALCVAGWVLAGLLGGDESLFLGGRLNEPLGYVNGQASFFVLAFWPCLALAERRRAAHASPLAGLGLAGATLFAGVAVLGQSRGAVLAAGLSLLLVLALLPGRLRRIVALLVSGACLAPALPALLRVYRDGASPDRLRGAAVAVLLAAAAAGVLWGVLVASERRASAGGLRVRRGATAGVAVLALAGAFGAVQSAGRITGFANRQYTAFVTLGGAQGEPTASRLATGAGNRYDYWRVAVSAWREHPLAGVGAGGYDKAYFAQRTTSEDIRQPHSLPLQVLSELGIAGGLLFAAGLVLIATGAWRRIHDGGRAPVVVAGLGVATAWLVHASVDWTHLLPGLTGVALLGAGVLLRPGGGAARDVDAARAAEAWLGRSRAAEAGVGRSRAGEAGVGRSRAGEAGVGRSRAGEAGVGRSRAGGARVGEGRVDERFGADDAERSHRAATGSDAGAAARSRRARLAPAILVGVAITIAALSLSRQGLSELYVERAQAALAGDPARALVESNRALRLDRESIAAYYAKAAALARFGEGDAARAVLLDAARREPRNFVTWALLGDLSVRRGDLRAARAEYRRALKLNPRDPGLARLAAAPRLASSRLGGG